VTTLKRYFAPVVALVVATATVAVAVRSWRRRQQSSPRPAAPLRDEATRSSAATRLIVAARGAGAGDVNAPLAARTVVRSFASVLPAAARRRIASHVAPDVAAWFEDPPVATSVSATVDELYADVVAGGVIPAAHVPWVVGGVLRELASLLPDDAADLVSELPTAIGHLWADAFVEVAAR